MGIAMRSFLLFQGSRPGLFYAVSTGDSCPLRILPRSFGGGELRVPPLIRREKDSGLPPVTAEKTSCPSHRLVGYVRCKE